MFIREFLNYLFFFFLQKGFIRTKKHKKAQKAQKAQKSTKKHKKHKDATKQKHKMQISE